MRLIALLTVAFVACTASATASVERKSTSQHKGIKTSQISQATHKLWECQDKLISYKVIGKRSKLQRATTLPRSVKYREWVLHQRFKRVNTCKSHLDQVKKRVIPETNDWLTAVRLVQRIYPGTSDWMIFISHREGGHGGFVMNHQGSGAGGWMQFMSSTYWAYSNDAFENARGRGFIVPDVNDWTHPLGQALTAGYMRYYGKDGCHWCL